MTDEEMLSDYLSECHDTSGELLGLLSRTNAVPELGSIVKEIHDYLSSDGPFYREDIRKRHGQVKPHVARVNNEYRDMLPSVARAFILIVHSLLGKAAEWAPPAPSDPTGDTP